MLSLVFFFELNDPLVVGTWTCEPTSWLTDHPDLADVLETWRESVSGVEPYSHPQVKNGLASARYPAELVESSLRVVREDLRGNEEFSGVAALSSGPSPHEDCLAEDTFVDDVRGGVLETERVEQAGREEVQWCRGMGVWKPVLRKDMDAEGAKAVSLRRVDTRKGDADRPNCRSRLQEGHEEIRCSFCSWILQRNATSGKCESIPLSVRLTRSRMGERQADPCDVRHQPCALPWSTGATSVCGTPGR